MVFSSWDAVLRLFAVGIPAYFGLILILRITGKRTLSQLSAFDFVVTVALGSTLATTFVSRDVTLADGLLAFALLAGLQLLVSWLSVQSPAVRHLLQSEPSLLAYEGRALADTLRTQRVSRDDLLAVVRESGVADLSGVRAVVLETNGRFAVIPESDAEQSSALDPVQGPPPPEGPSASPSAG